MRAFLIWQLPFDADNVDTHTYPAITQAAVLRTTLGAGDVLLIPAFWFHHIWCLSWLQSAPSASAGSNPPPLPQLAPIRLSASAGSNPPLCLSWLQLSPSTSELAPIRPSASAGSNPPLCFSWLQPSPSTSAGSNPPFAPQLPILPDA